MAFIVDFTWEVNCTQLCNNYRPISTVPIPKDIVRPRGSNGVYSWVYNKSMFLNDFFNNKSGLSTRFVCGVSLNITFCLQLFK